MVGHSEFYKRFLNGALWSLLGTIVFRSSTMFALVITARLLGKNGYGELAMINSTVGMLSTFAGMGLGVTCTKYIAELRIKEPQRLGRILGLTTQLSFILGGIAALALFFAAAPLASSTLGAPHLAPELRLTAFLLIMGTVSGVYNSSLVGFEAFQVISRIAIIQGLSFFPLMIGGVYYFGLRGAITALVLNSLIGFILNKMWLNSLTKVNGICIEFREAWREVRLLWKFSLPSMLSGAMFMLVIWLANTMLVKTDQGFAQLGLFHAANQWRTFLEFFPAIIGSVLLPMLSAEGTQKHPSLEKVNALAGWGLVTLMALPLIAFPEVIGFLYGKAYASIPYNQSLALVLFVSCVYTYKEGIARKLVANSLMWLGFFNNCFWGLILIGSMMIFKEMGAPGLALAYVIAYTLTTVVFLPYYIRKEVVPGTLLFSPEIILIWGGLIIQTIATLCGISFFLRAILFIFSVSLNILGFWRIWHKEELF